MPKIMTTIQFKKPMGLEVNGQMSFRCLIYLSCHEDMAHF